MSDGTDSGFIQDHTLGNAAGYFLYITEEVSESTGPAVLVTEPLHNSFLECSMEFWYSYFVQFYKFFFKTVVNIIDFHSIPGCI